MLVTHCARFDTDKQCIPTAVTRESITAQDFLKAGGITGATVSVRKSIWNRLDNKTSKKANESFSQMRDGL
jgi:hypothetical protein